MWGLALVVLVLFGLVGFASRASAESLSSAELEKLPVMVEWVYRNGAAGSPVGCGEGCAHLWSAEHGSMANAPAAREIWDQLGTFEASEGLWPSLHELAGDFTSSAVKFEVGAFTLGWHVGGSSGKWMRFNESGAATAPQMGWCDSAGSYYETLAEPGEAYGTTPEAGLPPQPKASGWTYIGKQSYCYFGGIGYYAEVAAPGCNQAISAPTPWGGWSNPAEAYLTCGGIQNYTALRTRPFHYSVPQEYSGQTATDIVTNGAPTSMPSREAVEAALKAALEASGSAPFNAWLRYVTTGEGYDPTQVPIASEGFGPGNAGEPSRTPPCVGDPVNCSTGNEMESQTDISVPGRGVPLSLSRTYNAQAAVSESSPGPFGYGWSSSFSDHLAINTEAGSVIVHQANGSTVAFKGNLGAPGSLSAPAWVQASLVLNSDGTYTYTLPSQEAFHFSSSGRLTSVADRDGNTTTLAYTSGGLLEAIIDPAGRKIKLAYNGEGLIESATDPMGHIVKYTYEAGKLASVIEPGEPSARWQFKYDTSHELTELIDGRGGKTLNEYDSSHRVIAQTDPLGRKLKFEYQEEAEPFQTTITNQTTGAVTKESFDGAHNLTAATHGYGTAAQATETSTYNGAEELTSHADGDGHTTTYTYDAAGNRTSRTDPLGDKTSWTYDATHDVETSTTPNGETTTITRNSHGDPETVSRPAPKSETQTTKYVYNSYGQLTSYENALKDIWTYEYNTNGDKISETDPEGDKRTWGYNEDSQETSTVSPNGNAEEAKPSEWTTTTEPDAQGRIVKVTDPLGHETKYAYDKNGNRESETDPMGHKTTYTYDADNELTKTEKPDKTVTEVAYDGAGLIKTQTNPKKEKTEYVRNALEEVTEITDPNSGKTTKTYDPAGNLMSLVDSAKRTTSYGYDEANRLQTIKYSDGSTPTVKYTYDKDGNRTGMTDGTGTTSNTWDQLDRLTGTKDGHGDASAYEYNLANEQTKITYPNGKSIGQAFDAAGRLDKIVDWKEQAIYFKHDHNSDVTDTEVHHLLNEEHEYEHYDRAGQLEEILAEDRRQSGLPFHENPPPIKLMSLEYSRNADGEITGATSKGLPGEEKPKSEYDTDSRLTANAGVVYEYNSDDNLTLNGSNKLDYNSANDEIASEHVSHTEFTYNEDGQRASSSAKSKIVTTYAYDQAGDLKSVTRPAEGSTPAISDSYAYDGDSLRASQAIAGTTSYLTWNPTTSVPLLLSDGTNSYIYGPTGAPVEQISSGEVALYYHHDQQNSTRMLTDGYGEAKATMTYDAYGAQTGTTGTATTPLRYDAQYTSQDTGLIYLRARVYDPATAQFLTMDPLDKLTRAPYNYVEDNPVNSLDPTGLCSDGSISGFLDCFNPVSSGNLAYKGAVALNNTTGIDLPWLLTRPPVVALGAAGVCAVPLVDAGCPAAIGAVWSVSTSSIVANGIETNFCNPGQLAGEEGLTSLLFGFGALGVYTTGAVDAVNAPGYARAIIRGGPALLEALLNGPLAANGG